VCGRQDTITPAEVATMWGWSATLPHWDWELGSWYGVRPKKAKRGGSTNTKEATNWKKQPK